MATANTEVPADQGGLPQLDFATFEEQVVWLFLTFIILFVIVWKIALPKIGSVLEEREEQIADDLDRAEHLRADAEDVHSSYEEATAEARRKAQETMLKAKDKIQADIAKKTAKLDAELHEKAAEAEGRIKAAKDEALAGIEDVAAEVAGDMVTKLSGVDADGKAVAKAVKASAAAAKGA